MATHPQKSQKKGTLAVLSLLLLFLTCPWFFTQPSPISWFGFPKWALWVVASTLLYSLTISFLLHRYWDDMDDEATPPATSTPHPPTPSP